MLIDQFRAHGEGVLDAIPECRVGVDERWWAHVLDDRRRNRPRVATICRAVQDDGHAAKTLLWIEVGQGRVHGAVRVDVGQQVRVTLWMQTAQWQRLSRRPAGVRAVGAGIGKRYERYWRQGVEIDPHDVDPVVVRAGRVGVDGDPLFIRFVADAVVGGHVIGLTVVVGGPLAGGRGAVWTDGRRNDLGGQAGVRLARRANAEIVRTVAVVEELIGEDELVIIAKAVEGADGVGIVGPPLVAGDMALDGPGRAAIE